MACENLVNLSLLKSLGLAACLSLALSSAALAQERKVTVSREHLPQASWYKARLLVDIVDESPMVNDLRNRSNAPAYEISIPPLAQAQENPNRNLVPVNLNGSNINRTQAPYRNLLPAARPIYAKNDTATPGRAVNRPLMPRKPQEQPGQSTSTYTYANIKSSTAPIFPSSTNSSQQLTKVDVRANLLNKTN